MRSIVAASELSEIRKRCLRSSIARVPPRYAILRCAGIIASELNQKRSSIILF